MGNTIKSRLHLHKKSDRPARTDPASTTTTTTTNPGHNQIDEQIMSAPNRVRAVEATASESTSIPPSTKDTTLTRGRD